MTDTSEYLKSAYHKLFEINIKNQKYTLSVLKDNNLANRTVIEILFDELDTITLQEAISVTPERNEKRKIWRRRHTATSILGKYIPSSLLENISQYYLILKRRDEFISKQEVMENLGINKMTLSRVMKAMGLKKDRECFMSIVDYEKIVKYCEDRISIKEVMEKLQIKKTLTFELTRAANISFVGGYISREEFRKLEEQYLYQELDKVKKPALILLKNDGLTQLSIV